MMYVKGSVLRLASALLALTLITACNSAQTATGNTNATAQQELNAAAPTNTAMPIVVPTAEPTQVPTTVPTVAPMAETTADGDDSRETALLSDEVVADARVVPLQNAILSFGTSGVITEVFAQEGQTVRKGQDIARLDTRIIDARIADASAAVADAQANLQRIRAAVTEQDIAAARAELQSAQAALAKLRAGPTERDVQVAEAKLKRAEANLQRDRDRLSAAKNRAELDVEKAADALRDAQDEYSIIYWENSQESDLSPEDKAREEAALRRVETAQANLDQARLDFELAQKAEITGIEAAETAVTEAKADLEELLNGPQPEEIAAAQADVAKAEARLASLTGPQREAEIASAQARLQQRNADLQQVRLQLEEALLRAPFDGIIAASNLVVGQRAEANNPVLTVANTEEWRIETRDLVELDVVRITEGAPAIITFDALPDLELSGTVERIRPAGEGNERSSYTTYIVTIRPDQWDARIRWNMTATVAIITT